MIESPPTDPSSIPLLHLDLSQVCVVDGIWQDMPDHIASFDEARLVSALTVEEATAAHGRGSLCLILDVSGEVEGRSEVERDLVETIRREYALRRGSVTFGLSEALRAANAALFDMNLQVSRESRRMAGVCAVVVRGQDIYIAEAGPAVVYVEVNGQLQRFPAESDWFTEDAPLYSPQGSASAPLGIRREFACDLFHASVAAGDVFVLATRALTQLVGTEELAHAISNRSAEDIAGYLEEIAGGTDVSAMVGELVDPRDAKSKPEGSAGPEAAQAPVVPGHAAFSMETAKPPVQDEPAAIREPERVEPEPVIPEEPIGESVETTGEIPGPVPAGPSEEELARLREERAAKRRQQLGAAGNVFKSILAAVVAVLAGIASFVGRLFGWVDWKRVQASVNRGMNTLFTTIWRGFAMVVRLVLPGAPGKQSPLIPRRASKEPLWLRVVAVVLPVIFVALSLGAYYQQGARRDDKAAELTLQAQTLAASAKARIDVDKPGARQQLEQALALIQSAREQSDSQKARDVQFDIQDQLNVANGVSVLYSIANIATVPGQPNLAQILADDNDIYFFDKAAERILAYRINDNASRSEPLGEQGLMLHPGAKVGTLTVDTIRDLTWVDGVGAASGGVVAVTGSAFMQFDSQANTWKAYPVTDYNQWGAIRVAAGFSGNLYLLDATRNQIWKYRAGANGLSGPGTPYLPANAPVDFSRAVDMVIDSDVWVLMDDGRVLRFQGGQKLQFDLAGLQVPLKNPTGIFTRPGVDLLYIVDAGNQRIVQFDKNGRYVRQFKPRSQDADTFDSLKALSANDTKRKFYFINGNAVYVANIP